MYCGDEEDSKSNNDSNESAGRDDNQSASDGNIANEFVARAAPASDISDDSDNQSDTGTDFEVSSGNEPSAVNVPDDPEDPPRPDPSIRDQGDSLLNFPAAAAPASDISDDRDNQSNTGTDFELSSGNEPSTANVPFTPDAPPVSPEMRPTDGSERPWSDEPERGEEQHTEEEDNPNERIERDSEAETPEAP